MTMADESKKEWYIVQTYSSYENKAKLALEERIAHSGLEEYFDQVFIPTETVTEVRNGKKRQVTRKFYNGYIFVKMHLTDQTWHVVKDTPKIVGFLGNQREPVWRFLRLCPDHLGQRTISFPLLGHDQYRLKLHSQWLNHHFSAECHAQ